jgi:hypothetical protein
MDEQFVVMVGDDPVTITVVHEKAPDLEPYGYLEGRAAYMVAWNDLHIDETRTGLMAAVRRGRWRRPPRRSAMSGSR